MKFKKFNPFNFDTGVTLLRDLIVTVIAMAGLRAFMIITADVYIDYSTLLKIGFGFMWFLFTYSFIYEVTEAVLQIMADDKEGKKAIKVFDSQHIAVGMVDSKLPIDLDQATRHDCNQAVWELKRQGIPIILLPSNDHMEKKLTFINERNSSEEATLQLHRTDKTRPEGV